MNLQDHPEARGLLGQSRAVSGGNREASEQKCTKVSKYTQVHEASVSPILDNFLECPWTQGPHPTINKVWSPFPIWDLQVPPKLVSFCAANSILPSAWSILQA